jgi:hypothetical protein
MSERRHDYVPQNAAQFDSFMRNLIDYVSDKFTAWGHIPQERFDELVEAYGVFIGAFSATQGPHTAPQNLARREAQAECARVLRAFVNQFLRFPPVTNVDRAEMGIPNHDTIRTDHVQVPEMVDFVIHLSNIRELVINFWILGADHKAKPAGYEGAVIIWSIGDAPPPATHEFQDHIMASRAPFTLRFEEAERGQRVWVALCWQNERGFRGAWSEFKDAYIP